MTASIEMFCKIQWIKQFDLICQEQLSKDKVHKHKKTKVMMILQNSNYYLDFCDVVGKTLPQVEKFEYLSSLIFVIGNSEKDVCIGIGMI